MELQFNKTCFAGMFKTPKKLMGKYFAGNRENKTHKHLNNLSIGIKTNDNLIIIKQENNLHFRTLTKRKQM